MLCLAASHALCLPIFYLIALNIEKIDFQDSSPIDFNKVCMKACKFIDVFTEAARESNPSSFGSFLLYNIYSFFFCETTDQD